MPAQRENIIIRMGSHSEKEYLEKTIHLMDGLIVGANLVEATPGATASLLVKFGGKNLGCPFYLDPMTYTFGNYVDPSSGAVRTDLDWIKSEQISKATGKTTREFKRSYKKLAEALGVPFSSALQRGGSVTAADFAEEVVRRESCRAVASYQLERIRREFASDPEYANIADKIPEPAAVFAPYFYIEPNSWRSWCDLMLNLARTTAELGYKTPVHAVVCADSEFLTNVDFLDYLKVGLPRTGIAGVWFWFSRFNEHTAGVPSLKNFRSLVSSLSNSNLQVFNMHGGFFSMALARAGLTGVSHGVGYGEQKDVMPVIGQSTPTVRYYLPRVRIKAGVPNIERCFDALPVTSPADFHRLICNCVVCKGVVKLSIDEFQAFGEMHRSSPSAKRDAQTPAAAKRCRYHFLLSRIKERDWMRTASTTDILGEISQEYRRWSRYPSIASNCDHLQRWIEAFQ